MDEEQLGAPISALPAAQRGARRYLILAAAVLMQMCLGATYSWSTFVRFIRPATGLSQAHAQIPFTVFYMVFPATVIVSGTLLHRLGPRRCAMFGGLVFGGGWLLASLGRADFLLTILGVGLLGGVGVGFAYIVPIATGVLWFPRNKGLVTGVAVAGFGGGAALVSQVSEYLMTARGATPFDAFRIFGLIFLAIVVLAGSQMRNPPAAPDRHGAGPGAAGFLGERAFIVLYFGMFTGLAAGFLVNANLRQLAPTGGLKMGAMAVSLFAVTNALGRVSWGFIFDRLGSPVVLTANLIAQALMLFAAPAVLHWPAGLLCLALLAGFNYGGVLVLYASFAAQRWGGPNVGQVYGWLFSANIPAAVSPLLAGVASDHLHSFTVPLVAGGVLLLAGAATVVKAER